MTDDKLTKATAGIVAALETAIEAGPGEWTMPWHRTATLPTNAATGKTYTGGNVFALWAAAAEHAYEAPYWGTYKQWQGLGAQVRKGETSTMGVRVQMIPAKVDETTGEPVKGRPPFTMRTFALFNVGQVDGWQPPAPGNPLAPEARHAAADAWFATIAADVRTGGGRAFYSPSGDYIGMPTFEAFTSPEAYYSVLAHEHIHWTGHGSREGRTFGAQGTEQYAREELVAEIGAALTMARLGMAAEPRPDHAQYLASWLQAIKDDPRALWRAAAAAQRATDRLVSLAGGQTTEEPDSDE
jgi:antirestriction protein ArdC